MKWYGLVPVVAIAACLAGCGKGKFSSSAVQTNNTLRYAIINTPTEFDPALVQDGDTIDLIQNMFEGLTTWSEWAWTRADSATASSCAIMMP